MKTKTFADRLPQTGVTAQTTDNTAASTGNSGTVKIGKGSDESCTINLTLTDSHFTVISNTGEGSSNVNTVPSQLKKKRTPQTVGSRTNGDTWTIKALVPILAISCATMLLAWLVKQNIKEVKTK